MFFLKFFPFFLHFQQKYFLTRRIARDIKPKANIKTGGTYSVRRTSYGKAQERKDKARTEKEDRKVHFGRRSDGGMLGRRSRRSENDARAGADSGARAESGRLAASLQDYRNRA